MILYLDTSGPLCQLWLDNKYYEWQADRNLAHGLLKFTHDCLAQNNTTWTGLTGLAFMAGPGSFTGLRIGATVLNTIANAQNMPIVGTTGKNWRKDALTKLKQGDNQKLVLPDYGGQPNITSPKR